MSPRSFSPLQRGLHWLMAAAILTMLFIGIGMVSTVSHAHLTLLAVHRPLGLAILLLAIVRLVIRLTRGTPPLPSDLPPLMRLGALGSHVLLYALMIALPLIGWAMMSAAGDPILIAGMHIPPLLSPNAALHGILREAHTWLALALLALILMHFAAALFHAWIRRDGVFEAMAGGEGAAPVVKLSQQ
ncbi:MAG TPA: cytochrome b/b6 domain-containing protein [Steroidobacteraceae bacterium]|nr:cytochrome b/b6 domain-containing protein [Steroidobacteraceae bacterium]